MTGTLVTVGGRRGKLERSWKTNDGASVEKMRAEFNELIKEGYLPTDGENQLDRDFVETQPYYEMVGPLEGG